jgi:hypothetical protein
MQFRLGKTEVQKQGLWNPRSSDALSESGGGLAAPDIRAKRSPCIGGGVGRRNNGSIIGGN